MPALNFVAVEDGLEEDPKIGTLGRMLHVSRALAVWFVIRLRRMVLHHGDHISGVLPKHFTDEDIASFLEFEGRAKTLVAALKRQGYLGRRSGRGYFYPDWENTITGRYTSQRERDRVWHEQERQKRQSNDVGRQSDDTSADSRTTSADIQTGRKEGRESGRPPAPPPSGGAILGSERWNWLMQHAQTPQNREVCTRCLAKMTPDDWALVQYAYQAQEKGRPSISRKNARTLVWPTDQFLQKQAFLRFGSYQRAFMNASIESATKPKSEPIETPEMKQATAWEFLRHYLADPTWSDAQKEKRKAMFFQQWGSKPWEEKPKKERKRR